MLDIVDARCDHEILTFVYLRLWYYSKYRGFHGIALSETLPKCVVMGN